MEDIVSVSEAARRLGVTSRRVQTLAASGRLSARRVGRELLIDTASLALLMARPARPGRPFSARSAWALLHLAMGRDPGPRSRAERIRARQRLQAIDRLTPGQLSSRAELHRLAAHSGLLGRIASDTRLVLGGASAAGHHGADLVAVGQVEGYVRADDLDDVIRDYALRPASFGEANVILRVPAPDWPFAAGTRVADAAVVGADLVDHGDERSVRAGRSLLESARAAHGP
jgi:excisionase family DNA binding protein